MANEFPEATARPWQVYEGGNFVKIGAEGYDEYIEREHYMGGPLSIADLEHNATKNYKPNHRKAMANAALIVTAVNSYDALREAAEAALKAIGAPIAHPLAQDALQKLRAALHPQSAQIK